MKKVLAWVFIIIGSAFLLSASRLSIIFKVLEWKKDHATEWYGRHESTSGDLVAMAMLDKVKKFHAPKDYQFVAPAGNENKEIDVYLFGDSYTEDLPEYSLANTHKLLYLNNKICNSYSLDEKKKNVLVIESGERAVREVYSTLDILDMLKRNSADEKPRPAGSEKKRNFSQIMNRNLEVLIFDYNLINKVRQFKASVNYNIFNRASGDVYVSENGEYLFFKNTVMPSGPHSSYSPVNDSTIDRIVTNLNTIYSHYKNDGFDEIYFSIIPNPATILQPEQYNSLIPRIKNHRSLRMPYIDVYDDFKKETDPASLYRKGDTHWSNKGINIWISKLNDSLRKIAHND